MLEFERIIVFLLYFVKFMNFKYHWTKDMVLKHRTNEKMLKIILFKAIACNGFPGVFSNLNNWFFNQKRFLNKLMKFIIYKKFI